MIDDQGRLFGTVNVIDAFVMGVVLVALSAGAGMVVVDGIGTEDDDVSESKALTLTAKNVGEPRASSIETGDRVVIDSRSRSFFVTDVYRTPDGGEGVRLVVRITSANGTSRTYRKGQRVGIINEEYILNATVTEQDSPLSRSSTNVTIRTTVPQRVAASVERNDAYIVADREVATVRNVSTVRRGDDTSTLLLSVRLDVIGKDTKRFAGETVRLGREIQFETKDYRLNGTIVGKGEELQVRNVTRTVTLQTTVPDTAADKISQGDTYRIGGRPVATIESVRTTPGNSFDKRRVRMLVTLEAVKQENQTTFLGKPLTVGTTITFDTRHYTIDAPIRALEDGPPAETRLSTLVTVEVTDVSAAVARALEPGMNYTVGGTVFATVEEKQVGPATVIVKTQDGQLYARKHPKRKDVVLTVRLRTRQTPQGTEYAMEPLRIGRNINLDFGTVRVRGTVTEIQD